MAEDWRQVGFALYVHWPFCESKCPYCDFNSHVVQSIDQSAWNDAYQSQLQQLAEMLPGRVLNSIYFGGGTPSLMRPDTVAAIIDTARSVWTPANDMEITLEANPGSVEVGRFTGYHDAGVNRISIGVQALNDADLRRLGRVHSVDEARKAVALAQSLFDRVSFDLIYARQGQSLADWKQELGEALNMASGHLSLYQLTIEDGTAFGDRFRRGKLRDLPPDDLAADMFELTTEMCEAAGMPRYEVSNHARPGLESRHNLIYWRCGDYAGLGPGAHGRVTLGDQRLATEEIKSPSEWLNRTRNAEPTCQTTAISIREQADEYAMMSLRLREGMDLPRHARLAGRVLSAKALDQLQDLGMIDLAEDKITITNQGVILTNTILADLLADLP